MSGSSQRRIACTRRLWAAWGVGGLAGIAAQLLSRGLLAHFPFDGSAAESPIVGGSLVILSHLGSSMLIRRYLGGRTLVGEAIACGVRLLSRANISCRVSVCRSSC
ncbi:hypothetical protein [Planctomycetes bacterium Pan216]|uniref:hypothetical protein n=1 Tax=Kolteria novifilia TaxID=2527975 RepID=UPI0011AAE592